MPFCFVFVVVVVVTIRIFNSETNLVTPFFVVLFITQVTHLTLLTIKNDE